MRISSTHFCSPYFFHSKSFTFSFLFIIIPRPLTSTLFPYTTLFRSPWSDRDHPAEGGRGHHHAHLRRESVHRAASAALGEEDPRSEERRVGKEGRSRWWVDV